MTASIVPFEPAHWQALAPRLHGVHRARIESLGAVVEIVPMVLAASSLLRTALIDGEPVAIMGMTEADGVGFPWLMKTDVAVARFWPLMRYCHRFIAECLTQCARLRADVPPEDEQLRHWLRWLGFAQTGPGRWELEA